MVGPRAQPKGSAHLVLGSTDASQNASKYAADADCAVADVGK